MFANWKVHLSCAVQRIDTPYRCIFLSTTGRAHGCFVFFREKTGSNNTRELGLRAYIHWSRCLARDRSLFIGDGSLCDITHALVFWFIACLRREPTYYLLYGSSEDSNSRPQSADSLFLASAASRAFSPLPNHQQQVGEARGMSPAGTPPSVRSVFVTGGSTSSSRKSEPGGSPALCHPSEVVGDACSQLPSSGQDLRTNTCVLHSAFQWPSPSDGTRRPIQNEDSSPYTKEGVGSAAPFSPSISFSRGPTSPSPEHPTRFLRSSGAQGFSGSHLSSPSESHPRETTPKRASHTTDNGMNPLLPTEQKIGVSRCPLPEEGFRCTTRQNPVVLPYGSRTESNAAVVSGRPSDLSTKLQERIHGILRDNCLPEETGEWQKKMQAHLCVHFCRQGLLARVLYMSERPSPHPLFSWRRPPGMYSTAGW